MIIPFRGRPERRYSDELPQSVEAVAQWEDGKIVVWVAPGLADEDGAVEAAESALLAQRRDERRHRLLLPLAAGYAAVRAHAGAASASAVTLLAAGAVAGLLGDALALSRSGPGPPHVGRLDVQV